MDVRSAELTKYAANAMLATRISFMNELANLADQIGADIELVRKGIGSDSRIGHGFLYAGTGYGGSCFPKDIRALIKIGKEFQQDLKILQSVEAVNQLQKDVLVNKIVRRYGSDLSGKVFAMWGLAFKPNTNDMREAPSRIIIQELVKRGAKVQAYDPVANKEALNCFEVDFKNNPEGLMQVSCGETMQSVLRQADALILVTEWKVFRSPDFSILRQELKEPIIFDGRNLYELDDMQAMGFEYYGIGRVTNSLRRNN
jgi:UDPglucose 6-dehydrogenase